MPKLSKIRLTGCKYDGFRKEHENSIFDLSKKGKADHSLFTLCNGGGKGVMMQLIFQLLLPETRWGKNNGNKVISMFYDQRNNLQPFTFHVVLEWILDTVPEKRLITGIAVKAIMKNTGNEEEEKTGLSYFLYTHEHDNNGYFTVENLPLYNNTSNEVTDLDELNDFISDNRSYFIKYSQSAVRRKDSAYFKYLESRGIYRSEWVNLKDINKLEGGAGDYFVGAKDNKSIFDKVIIPAISENIKNYSNDDGDNLIEMFKSNLSITKDLPILIKREADYKELLGQIKPLIENSDIGSRLIDIKSRLIDRGNDIYFILNHEESLVKEEIKRWEIEIAKSQKEEERLHFKKNNLIYNEEKKKLESQEIKVRNLELQVEEKNQSLQETKEEKLLYEINKILSHKKSIENEIENKTIEKEELEESMDIEDIKSQADHLDYQIELEWEKTEKTWIDIENQYVGYNNYIKQIKEENTRKINKYQDRIESLQQKVIKFELKEEDLIRQRTKLEETYDSLSLLFPHRIYEDLKKTEDETRETIKSCSEKMDTYKQKTSELNEEINRLNYNMENTIKNIKKLESQIKQEEKEEAKLSIRIAKQLLENRQGGLLSHEWFERKLSQLEDLQVDKSNKLESIQRSIWEKNIDKLLNKEAYFIPNKDILQIKEEIKRMDLHVQTGTEYVKNLDEKERLSLLEKNPGFIFSLVIGSEKDWSIIEKNISDNIFINNMVPIYIRSKMNSAIIDQFKIVEGKATDFIDDEIYSEWISEMEKEINTLGQTESNIKKDLNEISQIIQDIKIIITKDTALILTQKLKEENQILEENLEEIRILEEEKLNINNLIDKTKNTLSDNENKLDEVLDALNKINDFIGKNKEIEEEKNSIESIRNEIKEIKTDIRDLRDDNFAIEENQDLVKDSYRDWKVISENLIKNLNEVYEVSYDYKIDNSYINYKSPNFIIGSNRLESLISQRKIIEKDIASKNSKILLLNSEIKNLNKDLNRDVEELKYLSQDWDKYQYLELTRDKINITINKLKRKIKKLEDDKESINYQLHFSYGIIESFKEQLINLESSIKKTHGKPPIAVDIEDIENQKDIVEREIKANMKYLNSCRDGLEKNTNKRINLEINMTKMKNGYQLEVSKGNINKSLSNRLKESPDLVVEEWLRKCNDNSQKTKETIANGEQIRLKFIREIESSLEEDKLKAKIISTVKETIITNFKNNLNSFKSMEQHFQNELLSLSRDKSKAVEAMKQWTNRASLHIIRMIDALKSMVASMNYVNEQGYSFPLVKLKGIEKLPKEESEITHLLDEYFIEAISKILEEGMDISKIEDKELKILMGDQVIFSKALQGRYPTLLVYKMSEKNEFRYARARDEYYTTWEAINKGEGDLPEGSGGQTLSVNTFVIMMIMSFKKKHIGNENPSTVLVLDNPFGKASAKHVLDPIFEIADKLNFQLICFAAPEIIKVEISERFPVFWELKIIDEKVVHGGRVLKDVK